MPYVKQALRKKLDNLVKIFIEYMEANDCLCWDYILFKDAERNIDPGYNNYKNYIGEITESVNEMERRFGRSSVMGEIINVPIFFDDEFNALNNLVDEISSLSINGDLNYVLFAFGKRFDFNNSRYKIEDYLLQLKKTVGLIRDRILSIYENVKIDENGDVK